MKAYVASLLCLLAVTMLLHGAEITIDWDRAKDLHQRASRGETLSTDDQKYYEEARKQFQSRQRPSSDGYDYAPAMAIHQRQERGESITPEEKKILDDAMRHRRQTQEGRNSPSQSDAEHTFTPSEAAKGLIPLTELTGTYRQWDGGLYGGSRNEIPAAQQVRAAQALSQIQPLDARGKPSTTGKIVLMSIGMSNTTREFSTFVRAAMSDPRKAGNVVVVDAAQGGKAAHQWATVDADPWNVASQRLEAAGVTPQQVQVLWIKQANIAPSGTSEAEVARLQDDVQAIVTLAKEKYPQVRIAFLSSRIYAGYAQTRLNPEPYAYEGAFAVRGLIQKQISGDAALAPGKAPVLLWGPYLWAAGPTPRKADHLEWKPEDFAGDGTHPGESGARKVSGMLLDFFTRDANASPWFVKKSQP